MGRAVTLLTTVACLGLVAYVAWAWQTEQRTAFLPGETTHGHYQIELSCERCHSPFEGVTDDACNDCHAEELERADDSHPAHKFTDPRNADRVAQLDARTCLTCHVEHRPELTGAMGLTLPDDYCYRCHQDVEEERPTHAGLAFDSCQTSGCHNFHDNRSLHEDYLEQHMHDPALAETAQLRFLVSTRHRRKSKGPLGPEDQDAPQDAAKPEAIAEWAASAHAAAGVNCRDCHVESEADSESEGGTWIKRPDHEACRDCHKRPVSGFLSGRHGMRLAEGLSPMQPKLARLPMHAEAADKELGCSSCHGSHRYDRAQAAVEACLGCHADGHSEQYRASAHGRLWDAELAGGEEGTGVSCATCHLPRVGLDSADRSRFTVQHNQNENLRPNEKMIREVCSDCHGVTFSIDALADRELIGRNFTGRPVGHVESVDMVKEKLANIERTSTN